MNASLQSLLSVTVLGVIACCTNGSPVGATSQPQEDPTAQLGSTMKIRLKLQDRTLTATLLDTPTARDFASLLPLELTLKDYSATEKISDLPRKLATDGAPAGADPSVGDLAYYAPWGNLALYYKDFGFSSGLILLGKLDGGAEGLSGSASMKVTIERAKE